MQLRTIPVDLLPVLLFVALAPAACLDSDDKGAEDDPFGDLDAAKDDSFQSPTSHGPLAYNVMATSQLASSAKFHAWEFDVLLPGQTPTALATGPATSGGREVDTVVYLYKQQANGRWGSYIAKNDDANGRLWSYLSRSLDAGHYRVIVKGYSTTTYGKFGVTLTCDRYACSQPVGTCVFGQTFNELDRTRFAFGATTTLTSAVGLDATARYQIVAAMHASSHTDVATPEEAFMRADGGEINRIEMRDGFAVRKYVTWEYGAGDNSYGAIFDERDITPAAEIHDGDIYECHVPAATCIFGTYYDLPAQADLSVVRETTFNPGSDTTQLIRDQILAAVHLQLPAITTVGAVFDRVTDNEVRRVDVIHTPTRREYSFYTYILGDHRFGAAFPKDTSSSFAVEVEDNVFERCDAF